MINRKPFRIVHYINQFYAGIGGESSAGVSPIKIEGSVGPGKLIEQTSKGSLIIEGTIACGDNYFVENPDSLNKIIELIKSYNPDAFLAGPAFLAGRYGEACSSICQKVKEELGIPVITGLSPEHPSVDLYKKDIDIIITGTTGADMRKSIPKMVSILLKKLHNEEFSSSDREIIYKKGLKKNIICENIAAKRVVDMLLNKYNGKKWTSELPIPKFERVQPAPAVKDDCIVVALVTDGGLILKGNPENMPSGRSTRYCKISIDSWDKLSSDNVDVNHYGYDNRYVAEDSNRLVPLDAMRLFEAKGEIKLHNTIYSTAGVATSVENAVKFGKALAEELINEGVQAVILTST